MNWNPLAPRARVLFYAQAVSQLLFFWLPASLVGAGVLVGQVGMAAGLGVVGAVLFTVFVGSLWWPSLSFDRWAWARRELDVVVASGVLFRSVAAIPTNRIQHVDVRQGPLEQSLGLARVLIYTASGMGADAVIPGLTLKDAEALRDDLVHTEGDDGV